MQRIALALWAFSSLTGAALAQTGWHAVEPVRRFYDARQGTLGSDIQSMLPAGHIYTTAGESFVNWAHETTHGANSRIRGELKHGGMNAFYVGHGHAFILTEPKATLAQVAAQVPQSQRFGGFRLYLVQQQAHWNNEPSYILDEWVSYTNGTAVGLEINKPESMTLSRTIEFSAYAEALIRAVKLHDPKYSDSAKLREFVDWQNARVAGIIKRAKKAGALEHEHGLILQASFSRR